MKKSSPKEPESTETVSTVEVFRTNVPDRIQANELIGEIQKTFTNCSANFDLDDCDRILRVKCCTGCVEPSSVITLVRELGFVAEILPE